MQGAPLWLLGEKAPSVLARGKGAPDPWDRHEGHRGAGSPARAGQIRLATCSSHQEIRKPNCSSLMFGGPSRDENASGAQE